MQFSEALVKDYQRYMQKRCGINIPNEQAQLHLASLARLYIAFSFSRDVTSASSVARLGGGAEGRPEGGLT
jgi:hypothetical protein